MVCGLAPSARAPRSGRRRRPLKQLDDRPCAHTDSASDGLAWLSRSATRRAGVGLPQPGDGGLLDLALATGADFQNPRDLGCAMCAAAADTGEQDQRPLLTCRNRSQAAA